MASIQSLKRRIRAAQNVSKTTRAMQMIAASKFKRAQEAAISGRPYVDKLTFLVRRATRKIDPENAHPYLTPRNLTNKSLIIVFSPDKGLCGGLVTNLMREFFKFTENYEGAYIVFGKKAEAQILKLKREIIASFPFGNTLPTFDAVYPISTIVDEYFLSGKVESVKIISSHFSSIFSQKPMISNVLPIIYKSDGEEGDKDSFYLFEPEISKMLPALLKHYVEMTIYQQLLESFASEQASRMIAMQNATDSANDIIEDLKLEYNKSRQAKITSEILDITQARKYA